MNIRRFSHRTQMHPAHGGVVEIHEGFAGESITVFVQSSARHPGGISIVTMDVDELGHLGARLLAIAARLGHEHECKCNHNQSLVVKGS